MREIDSIQGLWRVVSKVVRGQTVLTGATHYLFENGIQKEIWPSVVDTGQLKVTFELNNEATPKTIRLNYFYAKKGVFPDTPNLVRRGLYRLDGEMLQISWGLSGDFPLEFSDEYGLDTLQRDFGPIPETRQPSGKAPIQDPVLGTLEWDDNINDYQGEITFEGRAVSVAVLELDGDPIPAVIRARQVVSNILTYSGSAKSYAAEELLDLANDWAYDAGQETLNQIEFAARISLESIRVNADGGVSFGYNDGEIFSGHWIEARLDAADKFYHAQMNG